MSYPALTITFLGTGTSSGVPMIACDCPVCTSTDKKDNRLRSSIMVQSATTTLVVDIGPDFRYQMLRAKVKHLDAILITRIPIKIIWVAWMMCALSIFSRINRCSYIATEPSQEAIVREIPYAFYEARYPGLPEVKLNTVNAAFPFTVGDIPVTPYLYGI